MAEENGVAVPAGEGGVRRITELRVVDLKAELKKRNLDINGNKSALMERLRQIIQEEGGNPDEISFNPETPNNRTSKRVGKGDVVDDSEVEDYREGDFLNRQELEGTTEDAEMLCAAELEPMQASDVIEETKVTSEEAGVVEDIYQKEVEGNTSVSVQVEGVLALGVDNDIHWATTKMEIDCKKPVEEKVGAKKIDTKTLVTENASKMGSSQQGHEVEEASIENVEQELQLRTVESKDEIMKTEDEDSDEATKKDPLIVEGSDQNKSSVEDEKDTNNEANPEKGRSGNINTGKNLLVHGLSADTRANDLKNLFRKYGKVICAKVVTDARNPGEHYYGFITMSTVKEATECISTLNQTELSGQTITVELAKGTIKKRTEEKGGSAKDSTSHSSRKTGNDSWSSRDKSSSNGKSQEDSKKQDHDRSKRRGKDDHRHRPSRSRSRSSERRRSRERKRTSRSRSRHRRSRSRHRRSRSRHRRSRSRHRRSSSHYRRSKSRRRRSSSRYRRSSSRHRRERSIEKLIELRERERHWDRKKEMWEMERRREREAWERETRQEREARKMLERELERLQLERLRLEKERRQGENRNYSIRCMIKMQQDP
ncbi:scaffold attachment factor B1-like isoform X2 [Heptranchias perlo]|uniref:scaffold attachment factor B1-like isoform X2 n=1 Tax=Heptranchias perlo TaxID=212740 RepID=UPI0035596894